MSAEDEDVKPNNEGSEPITIRVRDQVGRWRTALYFIFEERLIYIVVRRTFRRHNAYLISSAFIQISLALILMTILLPMPQMHTTFKTGEETFFKIKKSTRMQKVFDTYAQRKGIQASSLRFLLDGEKIGADQTPKMLELDDQDQIDCMLEQVRFVLDEILVSFVATF